MSGRCTTMIAGTLYRISVRAAGLAIVGLLIGAEQIQAQLGGIFGDPPRPVAPVPNRPPVQPLPPGPPPRPLQPPVGQSATPGPVQSQPLPPPPGGTLADPGSQPAALPRPQAPGAGAPAGQRQPANTALQPGDEVVTEMPLQKIVNPTAIFSGLDKITGRITTFDVAINETVQFGALQVTPRVCYSRPPTETPNTDAFIEVDEVTLQGEVKRLFTGWMFAASPGLHAVEHPIYDVWLSDCKGGAGAVAETQTPPPPRAATNPQRQSSPPPRQQTPRQPAPALRR